MGPREEKKEGDEADALASENLRDIEDEEEGHAAQVLTPKTGVGMKGNDIFEFGHEGEGSKGSTMASADAAEQLLQFAMTTKKDDKP